jgi:hypothetical protein
VILALALAAFLSFVGVFIPSLVPTRWLMAPYFSPSSISTVSPLVVLFARIGINLWLPASVFMALFWLAGFHRKLEIPKSKWVSTGMVLALVANLAATTVPFMVGHGESSGALMFVIGIFLGPIYLFLTLAGFAATVVELTNIFGSKISQPSHVPVALLSWAAIPPVLSLMPLLFSPSNPLALTAKEATEFTVLCNDVGIKLMERPNAPVRSIAFDWDPKRMSGRPWVDRIEIDSNGRIRAIGGFSKPNSVEAQKKNAFEFTESRRDPSRSGAATINGNAVYYHFPNFSTHQPYYGVEALTADVLVFIDVDKPDELQKAPIAQGAVRYQLTLSDRSSGRVLGVQTFVVDQINRRACGANVDNTISQDAFIYDALHH